MERILFIGMGTMGYPMAKHLQLAGKLVTVYNRTTSVAKKWSEQYGGKFTEDLLLEASKSDFVFACVGDDNDLRDITIGKNGVLKSMKPNSIFIDHTTASASVEKEIEKIAGSLQVNYLDAPVSGGEKGAIDGKLTIMCGGKKDVFEQAKK